MKNILGLLSQFFIEIDEWESHYSKISMDFAKREPWTGVYTEEMQLTDAECEAKYRSIIIKYLSDEAYQKAHDVLAGWPSRFDARRDLIIEPFYQHRGFTAVEFIKRWSGIEQRKRFLLKETDGKWLIYNYQRYNEEKNRWDKAYF
jgi:hypothetical protein